MLEDRLRNVADFYFRLPAPARTLAGSAYGLLPPRARYGPSYSYCSAFLRRSETWSREELADYSWHRCLQTVAYAYRRVPWYGKLWAAHGISPKDIQSPSDLPRIPVTTKADIKANLREFVSADARPSNVRWIMTSGSTGAPTRLAFTCGLTKPVENAFIHHLWRRVGYRWTSRMASLRGTVGSSDVRTLSGGHLWLRDPSRNRWLFSSIDMDVRNTGNIFAHMQEVRPEFVHAFPTALTSLAAFMVSSQREGQLPSLRAVLVGSEDILPWQLALWRRAFGPEVSVMRWYGLTERSALAGSCEKSLDYHLFPQYAYTELVADPDASSPLSPKEATMHNIVGTSFDNWVMPLIRFDTGDRATLATSHCACGRPYLTLKQIFGRPARWARTASGDWVPFTQVAASVEQDSMAALLHFQFIQETPGRLRLLLVPAREARGRDLARLAETIAQMVGNAFVVEWEAVDSIEALPGGKREYFVQKMQLPEILSGPPTRAHHAATG